MIAETIGLTTTVYIGNIYEKKNQGGTITQKKLYYAGSLRVAVSTKVGAGSWDVNFLLSDHLGSTSITTDDSGDMVSEMRYSPWGSVRFADGLSPTDFTYTGQLSKVDHFGLMYYKARWYDVSLGRLVQADTVIPGPGNPIAWDRFAYVMNNPIGLIDPSGHCTVDPYDSYYDYECIQLAQELSELSGLPLEDWINLDYDQLVEAMKDYDTTAYPDYDRNESAMTAAGLVVNWFFELGPDNYLFTEENSLTMDIMASEGLAEFREIWEAEGFPIPFTWNHEIDNRDEGLSIENAFVFFKEHFVNNALSQLGLGSKYAEGKIDSVGGVIGSLDRINVVRYDSDHAAFVVHNQMGLASGTRIPGENYSIIPNRPRSALGPSGTIWQIFIWVEPIPSQ